MKKQSLMGAAVLLISSLGLSAASMGAAAQGVSPYPAVLPLLAQAAPLKLASGDGEVRRIDKAGARLTIRHGELKEIDMPPMTMVFQVRDAALLETVKVGDHIRFTATSDAGRLTLMSLQVVK